MVLRGESNLNNQEQGKVVVKKGVQCCHFQANDYVRIGVLYFVYLFRCSWLDLDFS